MPGLSPNNDRFERIIKVLNDGLEATLPVYGDNGRNCWRCQRNRSREHWTLCEECRAYLACETDHDPTEFIPPAPPSYGWAYAIATAAAASRRDRAVTVGTNTQSA